jgi:WD40 repeat protein
MNDSVPPSPAGNPSAPQVPDHELIRRVGSGAFGEVWLARNVMGTYRAVKVVYRQTFEHERSYEREFTGMKKFEPVSRSHDGLVDILQVGRNDEARYYYYVMELGDDQVWGNQIIPETYDPKTLGKEVALRGKLPFGECVKLGLSLAAALDHLHRNGLIHRDIKPSNIIFVNGIPKVADIGLVADLKTSLPMERTVVGTIGFMPPEGPGTAQGDVYSLGKVLYEMSTGMDRQHWPDLPKQLDGTSNEKELIELNEVILKACEYDVRKRYQSAEEMHADLLLLQTGKSIRRLRALEQRLALATRIGVIALVIMLLGAGAYYQIYRENQKKTQRLAASYVAYGTRTMDEGDLIGSLPWFADAMQLEKGDPVRTELHKVRLAAILRECPKIVQMWFLDGEGHDAEFSRDGQRIVTAGVEGLPRLWDVNAGAAIPWPVVPGEDLNSASFSRDGRFVVTASEDRKVRVSDAHTGKEVRLLPHPSGVNGATFNPDGDRVVTACSDGIARVWDVASGLVVRQYTNHTDSVRSASFSPDGRRIVTASQDGSAHIWLVATGEKVGRQPFKHKDWVYHAAFSPDGRYVVTASYDRTAQIFDTKTGQRISLLHPAAVHSAEFSPDGRYVVTSCWDYTARIWNSFTGEPVKSPLKHGGNVMHASFSPEGRRIVTVTTLGVVCLWDLAPNNWLPRGISAYFSSDRSRFATVSNDTVRVWNAMASNSVPAIFTTGKKVTAIKLSPDGNRLLTLSAESSPAANAATTAQLWESSSGKALSQPFSLNTRLTPPPVSRDGQRMISIISNRVEVWDATIGARLIQLNHDHSVKQAFFNPAANRVVTISETNAYLWDVASGRMIGTLPHATAVEHAEFSPDNRKLVTACSDSSLSEREAQVWDVQTLRKIGSPLQHRDGVKYASFSPDSQRVVTASEDRTAQVWDAATGKRIGPPLRHNDEVLKAVFSQKDGRRIVTVCRDNTARVWDSGTGEPLTPPLKAPSAWLNYIWDAQFTGDGQSVVATKGGEARLYSLLPDRRKTEELVPIAQLLSAHQSDQVSGQVPLTRSAIETIWKTLRSSDAKYFSTSSEEILFWHEREADNSERAEEWFAAKFHVERMLEAKPNDEALQQRAARIQDMLTRAKNATSDNDEERSR